jgi:hypothetical protein
MSEKIKITCPRCKHKWEKPLSELEVDQTIYREINKKPDVKVVKYRAYCPNDGTVIIIEVQED